MNHEFVLAIAASVLSSTGGWGLLQYHLISRQKKAQAEKDAQTAALEGRRNKQAEDSQTWYRESRHHYEVAKDEAAEAKKECATCLEELRATRKVIYRLLEDLEDQVFPLLMLPDVSHADIRVVLRTTIKTARESL